MDQPKSDALVFFGATGDLAYKQIFPSLQRLAKRGLLNGPVIGVAKSGWSLDQFRARAKDSVEKHGGIGPVGFPKLIERLRYVDGDYADASTFDKVRKELGDSKHPLHYLAIPPTLFGEVIEKLKSSGNAEGARIVVEKPFGRDLESARAEPDHSPGLQRARHFPNRPLSRQERRAEPDFLPLREFVSRAALEPPVHRKRADHHGGEVRYPGTRRVLR